MTRPTLKEITEFANEATQWLTELPDRSSPDDAPEMCLVEPEELHAFLVEQLPQLFKPAKNRRPLVIIEAPYAADPKAFTAYLGACVADCHRRGESPIASVATYVLTGALNDLVPEERRAGIEGGLAWYRVADRCVAYVDHGISAGMQQGMARAQAAGVRVEIRELYPTQKEVMP